MLKPPHTSYHRIYTYHLKTSAQPVIADPDLIGIWPEGDTFILFFHSAKALLIEKLCRTTGAEIVYQADLDYADWETGYTPTTFTECGMTIAPVWEEKEAELFIDPSVVFGNGFHPSTRLCLRAMLSLFSAGPIKIRRVIDLGCGTGLLAIAAAKRGAAAVKAVDNNPLACQVAQANAVRNGMADRVSVCCEDLSRGEPSMEADLVLANLHGALLAQLMTHLSFWQASRYIISGFLPGDEERLLPLLPEHIRLHQRDRMERWCCWHLQKVPPRR